MSALSFLTPTGRSRVLVVAVCVGAAVGTAACGGAARSAPRVATREAPAENGSSCEVGTAAFERREYAAAAEAFDQCIQANPTLAYTYYRAGMAYYEADRADLMVARFETFVRLAPDARERPQVESILKTAAGRR